MSETTCAIRLLFLSRWETSKKEQPVPQKLVHQAVVRRHVVIGLIAAMVSRGHPAYKGVDMDAVTLRAEQLPEDGVPVEIVALFANDEHFGASATPESSNACQ